jgi:osmotically-inducible protein OsmY
VSRIIAASVRLVLAAFVTGILALGQVACAPQSSPDTRSAVQDPAAEQAVDDNVIKLELNRRLINDGLGLFKDVSTVVYDGRVLLIGSVDQPKSLERAGNLALEIDGVQEVINEIQVDDKGGIGAFISDVIIEKSIQSDYLFDDAIKSAHFRVRSVNGVVYMIGRAESRVEYDRAIAIASETADVKRVVNYVAVSPE